MSIPVNSQVVKPSRKGKFIEKLTKVYNQVKAELPFFDDYGEELTVDNMLRYLFNGENDTSNHPLTKLANKDINIISVDPENFDVNPDISPNKTPDGVEYVIMRMGGDWEIPVYYVVYFDEDEYLRCFLSYKGNKFNFDDMCAFGEDCAADSCDALKHYPECVQPVHTLEETISSKLSNFPETIDAQFIEDNTSVLSEELSTYLVDGIIYGKVKASEEAIDLIPYEVFEENYALSRKCESDADKCVEDFIEHYKHVQ